MKKRIFPRIMWFLFVNCMVFVLLVAIQFTRRGNFSERVGDMLINGRYALSDGVTEEADEQTERRLLDGGVNVFFGGLEFRLAFSEYITILENEVIFALPNGTELTFTSQNSGLREDSTPELRIWGKFPDDVSSVVVPFKMQRASVVRDNGSAALTISYNGNQYQFNRPLDTLESGQIVLLATAPVISYRVITDQKEFRPADFIVPQVETVLAYADELALWTDRNFRLWSQMDSQTDEDTIIAWCGEAVRRNAYRLAVATVPLSFSPSPQRTWESAVYQFDRRIGVWQRAVRGAASSEREKISSISRLLGEQDKGIFIENRLIEFLAIRNYEQLITNFLSFAVSFDSSTVTLDMCPGILESYLGMNRWRPRTNNPFTGFVEGACQLVADNLHKIGNGVFVFADDHADTVFNLRLGMALNEWGEQSGNNDWAGLGRSLIFSVLSLGNSNGSIPASLTMNDDGEFIPSANLISSAKLYRFLGSSEYLPHAAATGENGIWAWTAASSININQSDRQIDISVNFPAGETHYVMLRNIQPFPTLQIHDTNWRRAADFESYYDASGWYYFEDEQILVLKIRHRSNVENIRILYTPPRVETPPAPPEESPEIS